MSQHDYIISNDTGANVRTDINNALQAIVTGNSGSSPPSTFYKHQTFIDEMEGIEYRRNQANSASFPIARVSGSVIQTVTANTVLTAADACKIIVMGVGCATLTLPSAAAVGAEWYVDVLAQSAAVQQMIVSPSGNINGFGLTIYQPFGTSVRLISTGSAWVCVGDFLRGGYWAGTISSTTITAENTETQCALAVSGTVTIPATVSSNKWTCPVSGVWDIYAAMAGNFTTSATNYGVVRLIAKVNATQVADDVRNYPTQNFTINGSAQFTACGIPLKAGDLIDFYAFKYSGAAAAGWTTPAGKVRFALR